MQVQDVTNDKESAAVSVSPGVVGVRLLSWSHGLNQHFQAAITILLWTVAMEDQQVDPHNRMEPHFLFLI